MRLGGGEGPDELDPARAYALRGEAGWTPIPPPYLVLLDINMPQMNEIEFLHQLRQDPELTHSIVFVLTTSEHEKDKRAAYNEQVAGYIVKQRAGGNFLNLTSLLSAYWRVAEFPLGWSDGR